MTHRQKLVVISQKQVQLLEDKEYGHFIKSMIGLGATLLHEAEKIESIQGPFNNTDDDSFLMIINIVGHDHK